MKLNKNKLRWIYLASILLLLLSLLAEIELMEGAHHTFGGFGFFAWFGFLSSFGLILIGKVFGFLLKRKDNYYDD